MAISNITSGFNADGISCSITLTDASGSNRKLLAAVMQDRNPPNLTAPTFDGVTGTLVATVTDAGGAMKVMLYEWNDSGANSIASLPAAAGTYTLATTGATITGSIAGVACSGAKQTACADPRTDSGANANDPSFTLTADAGSLAVIALADSNASATITTGAGQTDILAPTTTGSSFSAMSYDSSDLTVSYTRADNNTWAVAAAAIEPAAAGSPTLTDVDTDESITPGQASVVATGTNLSSIDELRFYDGSNYAAFGSVTAASTTVTANAPSFASMVSGNVPYGAGTVQAMIAGVSQASISVTMAVESGFQLHTVSDISQAADADCLYNGASPAVAVGDVIRLPTTSTLGYTLTVDSQGFPAFASGGDERTDSFVFRIWDDSVGDWSAEITYEVYSTPVLSAITGTPTSNSTADVSVATTQAEGTIYVVVSTSATAPTAAQIKAGNDHTGSAADGAASDATPTATTVISVTGLGTGTRYAHAVQSNAASTPVDSAVVSSAAFTVTSPTLFSVGTDDTVSPGDQNVACVTTGAALVDGFLIKTGTRSVACTGIVAADTTLEIDIPAASSMYTANVKFGGTVTFDMTDGGVSQATLSGTVNPESGYTAHDVTTIADYGQSGNFYSAGTAVGDRWFVAQQTVTNQFDVTFDANGNLTFVGNDGNVTDTVSIRHYDDSAETWAAATTYEISTTPTNAVNASKTDATTATAIVTSDVLEGTVYLVVTTSSTAPSTAQIALGQDHTGAAATFAASDASVTESNSFSVTGLTGGVTYYAHACQINAAASPVYGAVVSAVISSSRAVRNAVRAAVRSVVSPIIKV